MLLPKVTVAGVGNRVLSITYRSYYHPQETQWLIEPCGIKQYRRRWYLIGNKVDEDFSMTFALDRIVNLELTDNIFEPNDNDCLDELFDEVVGVFVDDDLDVEDVVVRVYGKQRNYFEGTPLHHSQTLVNKTEEYCDYSFHLRPEYEFQHEILRLGPDAEVLSPEWLRSDMAWYATETLKRYQTE